MKYLKWILLAIVIFAYLFCMHDEVRHQNSKHDKLALTICYILLAMLAVSI